MLGGFDEPRIFRIDDVLWVTPTNSGAIEDVYLTLSSSSTPALPDVAQQTNFVNGLLNRTGDRG